MITRFLIGAFIVALLNAGTLGQDIPFTVTPTQPAAAYLNISPSTAQIVTSGTTRAFTVTAKAGYTRSSVVGGNCPTGSWNGSIYTTGAISAHCTLVFYAAYSLSLDFFRVSQAGPDPFDVTAHLNKDGKPFSGQTLQISIPNIPKRTVSAVTDNGDGSYKFRVTPATDGLYSVQVSYFDATGKTLATIKRSAVVATALGNGVGQPLSVPGSHVNTEGYEDGPNITPDGKYLFVQTGPFYMSGVSLISSICPHPNPSYPTGYDILGCANKPDSNWIFDTVGPYIAPQRPRFPTGAIVNGKLTHINISIPGHNGIALFPNIFYGFKRQGDGTFAEPFKVAFNDIKGMTAGTGINLKMTGPTTAQFILGWNNRYHPGGDLGGDGKDDVYYGNMTLGQDTVLGDVTWSGEDYTDIVPKIAPVSFTSHTGDQSNPFMFSDASGAVKSIWVDSEQGNQRITVYNLTSGTFPSGTWAPVTLPNKINLNGDVHMPFFTGIPFGSSAPTSYRLYFMRGTNIVYRNYNGPGGADYGNDNSWGNEVLVLQGSGGWVDGTIYAFGEPTIAVSGGKKYLYFTFMRIRSAGSLSATPRRFDLNSDIGFVEIP